MPSQIKPGSQTNTITEYPEDGCERPIFSSPEEMRRSMSRCCYGNFYTIGTLWIEALKSVLVGTKICLFPRVYAAKKEGPPERPPKMKYTNLDLYDTPHKDYLEYEEAKHKCPERNTKLLQARVMPYVVIFRDNVNTVCDYRKLQAACKEICNTYRNKWEAFKKKARDPGNYDQRKMFVIGSTLLALYLGSRKHGHIHKRFFWGGLTALFTGWLCFPTETDKYFRDVSYEFAYYVIRFYNMFCGKRSSLSYAPCESEMPAEPKDQSPEQKKLCPPPPPTPPPKKAPPAPVKK